MARERDRDAGDRERRLETFEGRRRDRWDLDWPEEIAWRGPGEGPGYGETRPRRVPFLQSSTGGQIPGEYREWEAEGQPQLGQPGPLSYPGWAPMSYPGREPSDEMTEPAASGQRGANRDGER